MTFITGAKRIRFAVVDLHRNPGPRHHGTIVSYHLSEPTALSALWYQNKQSRVSPSRFAVFRLTREDWQPSRPHLTNALAHRAYWEQT